LIFADQFLQAGATGALPTRTVGQRRNAAESTSRSQTNVPKSRAQAVVVS
jgi:hypothetical protein